MRKIPLFFLCLLSTALPAASARLAWSDVRQAVLLHDPVLASARADAEMADQMALAAYAWMPPQLSVELMGLDPVSPDLGNPMQTKWSLTQELPFPGRTWAQGRVASHVAEGRHADADMAAQAELKAAREAYYSLAGDELLLRGLDTVSDATQEMAKASARRAAFGQLDRMGQFMDAMLAMENSDVDAMRPMVLQQRRAAEATLRRLMGADPAQPLPTAEPDVDRLLAQPPAELKEALEQAEARDPRLRSARAGLAAAQAGRDLALSGWLPDLMAQASVTDDTQGPRQAGAMLGVSVPWLWFWKQAGEAGAARAARDKAAADLEGARLALREQVAQAVGELNAVTESLRATWTRTAPQAAKGLELARTGFRTTALGPTEILMAVQDYRSTQQQLAQLIAQWGSARAMLDMLTVPAPASEEKP